MKVDSMVVVMAVRKVVVWEDEKDDWKVVEMDVYLVDS